MHRRLFTAIAVALAAVPFASVTAMPAAPLAEVVGTTQLPREVRPSHYDVSIVPHADALGFDGKVQITLDVLKPTAAITLNALNLKFATVTLSPLKGGAALTPKISVDDQAQTATFTFPQALAAGSYRLSMAYTGKIETQANGLFVIDYDTKAGHKKALYTQFENSDARRFIPSWDEPAYKATFTLTADVPDGQMAVSNMPAATEQKLGNGLTRVTFQQSPKMSTYLLFFGVGEFERVTTHSGKTEIGVVTQKGMSGQAGFELESAKAILAEYNDYFGVPYPLPKLDNIAAPGSSQFFSAMENWGSIFTFEYAMLLDPSISTVADKENVFDDAAHEMAHQWFGDLVTMRWWDDLWLNEGFASWMSTRTTEKLHPEWHAELSMVGIREGAMSLDAIPTSHPIVQHVETVEQAAQAFDSITYSKGESVIHMLENYVGPEVWREGVRRYIKAHAYGNTVSDDLWQALQTVTDKPITQVAHDFTLQAGVPLLTVTGESCNNGATTISFEQGQFVKGEQPKIARHWHVPVTAAVVGGKPVTGIIDGKGSLTLPGCGAVVVNAGQAGYYRTLYSTEAFNGLKQNFAKLAPIDQLGLLSDTFVLGQADLEPVANVLDLIKAAPDNASPELWSRMAGTLSGLYFNYRDDEPGKQALARFGIAKLQPELDRIGWIAKPDEGAPVALLRNNLIVILANFGDQKVIDEANRRFAAQKTDPQALPAALRKIVTAVVAIHANEATWNQLHAMAKAETTPMIKDQLYSLLGLARDQALAQRALDLALTPEPGATNSASMIGDVSEWHPELAFDFATGHLDQVNQLVGPTSRAQFFPRLLSGSLDPASIGKLQAFAKAHIEASSQRTANTVISALAYRQEARKKTLPQVDAWLKANP